MALDYRKCAQEIVNHIGGRENVAQAAHCATRLRLVIKDNSKVDKEYLDNVEGVKGMFESNGQLQLIIGTGTVNKVYDEFLSITGMSAATKDEVKAAAAARQPLWKRLLKPIGDVFVPILPAIVASGLMMGLVEALGKANPSFASTDWYAFLDLVANTAFVFLPVIIAVSAARVFGGNIWMPIASAANFAQFGACLAVALKSRRDKTKSIALPSSLSAALGITEPAIFGVNLRFYKPFVGGMIGGAVGSLLASFMGIGASAYGVTGIPGYLTIEQPAQYTLVIGSAAAVAFAITWMFFYEEVKTDEENPSAPVKSEGEDSAAETPSFQQQAMIRCEAGTILTPVKGTLVPQAEIPDNTFSQGILGAGAGILPDEETVYAPCDGTVSSIAESRHALGITGPGDMEILIHVGVDTVSMAGDGFEPLVTEGAAIKEGQPLLRFSKEKIAAAGHPDIVVVLLTNSDDYHDVRT